MVRRKGVRMVRLMVVRKAASTDYEMVSKKELMKAPKTAVTKAAMRVMMMVGRRALRRLA